MKRYLLFAGCYYDKGVGGWSDFVNSFDTLDDAKAHHEVNSDYLDAWWHIVDMQTGEIVAEIKE